MEYGLISVLPPLLTIGLALITRNVYLSLFTGVISSYIIIDGNIIVALNNTLNGFANTFTSTSNVIVMGCILTLGVLTYMFDKTGGINGFVNLVLKQKGLVKSPKGANIFTFIVGCIVYTSGTLSTLIAGSVCRPVNDYLRVPHEKAAYIVHTTSMPVCLLFPLSGWAAVMMGALTAAGISDDEAMSVLISSIPYNIYAILVLIMVPLIALTRKDFGPMKKAEKRALETGWLDDPKHPNAQRTGALDEQTGSEEVKQGKASYILLPLAALIVTIIVVLLVTGKGSIVNGSGTQATLWSPFVALVVLGVMVISQKQMKFTEYLDEVFKGAGQMVGIAAMLMMTYAMGTCVATLDTGNYLASLFSSVLSPGLLPVIIFLVGCVMSFATGTSTGTFNIMMPIAVPMAISMDANLILTIGSVWAGALFDDHASPISDTTIMSCSTTGCDIIDHVRSQLPYALTAAAITIVAYLSLGMIL
ncbi:MAG: Na+/H+ antiporter NhaC family protein [Anaerovoracaceae bacterium]|nr:hypothetical protein [Bacillota bacterium]MEE0517166.1 Na+/H+ antiporter NhaC family protein [Anaerovoracaceae bacterium]